MCLPCEVIVIQHVKEAQHAKNTLRLAALVAPSIEVLSSSNEEAMQAMQDRLQTKLAYVIYPTASSRAVEKITIDKNDIKNVSLILLDGSWRQAYAIWSSHAWLRSLNTLSFENPPVSQYEIRKAHEDYQLSTIEALAYSLESMFSINSMPFYKALDTMQDHWQHVRHNLNNKN